ncbi:hypothetical protein CDL12_06988 [Handroanthus impetiginosus]|uniref:Uncharacterized protein n=1 Tax=Handroanthus impetiginosus TaxID=429701 RepID=A0A2G9HS02_9LAMI|nr:hypothetical protein CDL12_06988 [Handroanthus impetiginosus]
MSFPQETPVFPTTYAARDHHDDTAATTGCGCFRRFCFGRDEDESYSYLLREREGRVPHKEFWILTILKKLKELSELVAGPKWKNLIRKIGKICNSRKYNKPTMQFQYSPETYALNFAGDHQEDDANLLHSFSTRFAPPGFPGVDQQRKAAL